MKLFIEFLLLYFVFLVNGLEEVRPGQLCRNIKTKTYPKLRKFLLQTLNNETLLKYFMSSRLSCGEEGRFQALHNALKVAASYSFLPESVLRKGVNSGQLLNLDELFGKSFVFAEVVDVPFLKIFGPEISVNSFAVDTLKEELKKCAMPVVYFKLKDSVTTPQKNYNSSITIDERTFELYVVNDNILCGEDGVFYRLANADYAPILGEEFGEELTSLVYILSKKSPDSKPNDLSQTKPINPVFTVIAALFLGFAISFYFVK